VLRGTIGLAESETPLLVHAPEVSMPYAQSLSVTTSNGPPQDSVLLLSAVSPLPVDNGKRAVLNGLVNYLVGRLGSEHVHYGIVVAAGEDLPELPCQVHRLPRPPAVRQLGNVLTKTLQGRSLQECALSSPALTAGVAGLLETVQPTLEIYDTLRLAQHAPDRRYGSRVVYLDDLFSVRYQRMLTLLDDGQLTGIDFLGEFAANIPSFARRVVTRPSVARRLLRLEQRLITRSEDAVVEHFDLSLLVNSDEVEQLRARTGSPDVQVISPLVPEPSRVTTRTRARPELVFLGRLNIPHNDDAICTFLREVLPAAQARIPGLGLRIIGRSPSRTLQSLAEAAGPSVRLEGFVEDLDEALGACSLLIAPLQFGSGVKIKILDSLARGLPVLGTTTAVEGIPVAPAGHDGFVVEDDLQGWPELIAGLLEPAANERASAAARSFYLRVYAPDQVEAQYDELFPQVPSTARVDLRREATATPAADVIDLDAGRPAPDVIDLTDERTRRREDAVARSS
jgi:glycosyltransferase involved in cell wall biosynthesis